VLVLALRVLWPLHRRKHEDAEPLGRVRYNGREATRRASMWIVTAAQPIRRYGPPSWIVWTSGEPCSSEACVALTAGLARGEVKVVERGRWGPYNVIACWRIPARPPWFFLAELDDAESK
jgi:hypothetical protein